MPRSWLDVVLLVAAVAILTPFAVAAVGFVVDRVGTP